MCSGIPLSAWRWARTPYGSSTMWPVSRYRSTSSSLKVPSFKDPTAQAGTTCLPTRPMQDWVREMCAQAGAVVALGDCGCCGGIPATAPNPVDNIGLQYLKRKQGGFLGADFKSKWGPPVINIPAAPHIRIGSRKYWSLWPPVARLILPSTTCSVRKLSSKEVCLAYLPDIAVGDYTVVHAGFAITRVDEVSAMQTLATFKEMGLLDDEFSEAV